MVIVAVSICPPRSITRTVRLKTGMALASSLLLSGTVISPLLPLISKTLPLSPPIIEKVNMSPLPNSGSVAETVPTTTPSALSWATKKMALLMVGSSSNKLLMSMVTEVVLSSPEVSVTMIPRVKVCVVS